MINKAVAYIFGNNIIGTVMFTDEESCVFVEADFKGLEEDNYKISINCEQFDYDFISLPCPCRNRVKLTFYVDFINYSDLCGRKIYIKGVDDEILAAGRIMQITYGKRYYAQ